KPGKSVRSQEPGVQQVQTVSIPQSGSAQKTYTVQVGAFSHPAIAQEWAQKWKARGYDVSLKPVARPKTGVIYRLYLGNFTSEKKADDLVKHLKSKEGINAIRLLVRN
ncbi:MAG TPA: SPOR domain-containing protein, partial [Desulfomonilaceae bacterium]|nr:SPOR domain-containing protein [Desulfomonilaceae bacterium]